MSESKNFLDKLYADYFKFASSYETFAHSQGESLNSLLFLQVVWVEGGGLTQRQIAQLLGIPKQTVSFAAAGLERRGLISMESAESDGRAKVISLTKDGRTHCSQLFKRLRDLEVASLEGIDDNDLRTTAEVLERFMKAFSDAIKKPNGVVDNT